MVQLDFNKRNLMTLLLTVHQHRSDGIFLSDLWEAIAEAEAQNRGVHGARAPSRSTWFNYFRDIDHAFPDGLHGRPLSLAAHDFVRENPKLTDKFFRKFRPDTFARMCVFLFERGYWGSDTLAENLASVPGSLYFSLVEFLKPAIRPEGDHNSLPGVYRVYRPSLSAPGKILVSAALVTSKTDGSLHYAERMHFRTSFGWREQHLEGYILGVEGKAFLLTKDDNTKLPQFSILKPLVRQPSGDGETHIVRVMAGSYTGSSTYRENGHFSTGIVMVRDNLRSLEKHPIGRWKIGLLGSFGLQNREDVPEQFLKYLYE
ncbi:hypothetical protein [Labrenzia sp. R5_0]|uniref:hypothetical protein n=1 Tax=Labrenzia sp. R5_0 TaxID=2821108 RepID=UPI001ADD050E|nr:hypothetical protein [Labrenzia sp. R5_0]MBO9462451.1 hypothetical protein [Labrenzia sp. R5_0]